MVTQASLLGHNFQNMYSAAFRQDKIVANFKGTRIYNASYGMGKLWNFFYFLASLIGKKNLRLQKLQHAWQTTQTIFQNNLPEIRKNVERYQNDYLKAIANDEAVDPKKFGKERLIIYAWNHKTLPFLQLLQIRPKNMKDLFQNCLQINIDITPTLDLSLTKSCERIQSILPFESLISQKLPLQDLKHPLPLAEFSKFWSEKRKRITSHDDSIVKEWVSVIQGQEKEIDVRLFHQFLRSLVALVNEENTPEHQATARLELRLLERGCKVLNKEDKQLTLFKEELVAGEKVYLSRKEVTLGKRIGQPKAPDHNWVFEDANDKNSVIVFGTNRASLGMKNQQLNEYDSVLFPIAPILEVDSEGCCARVEKMERHITDINWTSTDSFSNHDREICDHILPELQNLLKQNRLVQPLSLQYLMLSRVNLLKSVKHLYPAPFNFNTLENLIKSISRNNLWVFQHLMNASGMTEHFLAEDFYRDVIEAVLTGKSLTVESIAASRELKRNSIGDDDAYYIETKARAEQARKDILEVVEESKKKLKEKGIDLANSPTTVEAEVLKYYQFFGMCGIILKEPLIDAILHTTF